MLERIADGRTDLVFDLLAKSGVQATSQFQGVPILKWCAHSGDVSAIKYLLSQGERLASLGENLDLNGAVFHGHLRLCEYLIEQGADVNWPLPDTGETPLHSALCNTNRTDQERIISVLLANGAKPNCTTRPGVETDSFMRDIRTRAETPLHRAAAFGTEATIQLLLDAGAHADVKDMNGDSPLTWASWHVRPRTLLRLLCYGPFRV